MSKSTPKAPDYAAAAQEQAQSSKEVTNMQTWANRPDQVTPWGTTSWDSAATIDPATGQAVTRWTQNTTLDPTLQAALDSQMQLQLDRSNLAGQLTGRMQNEYGRAMDWSGLPQAGQGVSAPTLNAQGPQVAAPEQFQRSLDTSGLQNVDPSQRYYQQAGDAVYNQWASRAMPAQQQAQEQLRTRLYNQGLKEGDQAYDNEMAKLRMQQGDAQQQAAMQATQMAGSEAQRMYGMDQGQRQQQFNERLQAGQFGNQAAQAALGQNQQIFGQQLGAANYQNQLGQQGFQNQLQASQYQNQLRQQALAEQMQQRGFSLNEINALLNGQQVNMPSMPNFSQAAASQGLQSLQAADMQQQANLANYNAQQQAMQGMMSGIGSVAGGIMTGGAMSDRRMKKHIRRIGTTPGGTPVYRFNYVWGGPRQIGVMADEVPHAVVEFCGFKFVDYSKVT